MILALSPYIAFVICCVPWLLIISKRFGAMLAALVVLFAVPTLLLVAFIAGPFVGIDPTIIAMGLAGVAGVVGLVLVARDRATLRRPSLVTLARWVPSLTGGLAWLFALSIAQLIPNASVLAWAMNGDSANNLHLSRTFLADHGVLLASNITVPLSNEMLSVAMAPGRTQVTAGALLEHDLTALSAIWALSIAACGVLLALVAASLLDSRRPALLAIASTGGSLLALSFFVVELPIESGYFNVPIALPFALASWLAYLQSRRSAVLAVVLLSGFGFLLLSVWTPLVVIPGAFLLVLTLRGWSHIRQAKPGTAIAVGAATVLFVGYLVLSSLPALVSWGPTITTPGHGFPFTVWIFLLALLIALTCAAKLRRSVVEPIVPGLIALAIIGVGGYVFLVYLTHADIEPWLYYYPTKFSFMLAVVFGAIALSLLVRLISEHAESPRRTAVAMALTCSAVLVLCSLGPAPTRQNFVVEQPLAKIIEGHTWHTGEAAAATIIANADRSTLLWNSGNADEAFINFWLLDFNGAQIGGSDKLRNFSVFGYRELRDTSTYSAKKTQQLCDLLPELPVPTTVYTADSRLASELQSQCPGSGAVITVGAAPSGNN